MKKHSQFRTIAGALAVLALCVSPAFADTGPFTSPLTTAVLSVDLNGGGPFASVAAPTEGWNGSYSTPSFSADQYGVTWSPWGGPANTYGDTTQLPSSQSSPNINASTISKTFGSVTATLSIDTTLNSSKYGTVNGVASMNSRDRGGQTGVTYLPPASSDGDIFRDLVFAGSTSAVQGENYLKLTLSGLTVGASYEIALYSFDGSGGHSMNWTAIAPTTSNNLDGWWAGSPPGNNTFTAPLDQQTITWAGGGTNNFRAPAVFTEVADAYGDITVYGYGGTGSGQNTDSSYLNAFQVVQIPEPSSVALLGLGALLVGRLANSRRRSA